MKLYLFFKRAIDIIISSIGVVMLVPLFIVLSIWIKLTSKGPVIFKQIRGGKNKKSFTIYKFRSMVVGARNLKKKGVPTEKLITSTGRFMRKFYLDETPQLFNVLKGDMSLVGPRPGGDVELKIKPGITSIYSISEYLSQKDRIKFEEHFKGLLEKDKYKDFTHEHREILTSYYTKNVSFILDAKIIFYTFLLILKKIFSKGD